jgi:cytochrome c-type biogenesis protein CcmI
MMLFWLIFAAMTLGVAVFLAKPLFFAIAPEEDAELASYFAQIDALKDNGDIDPDEVEQAIAGLQRQILDRRESPSTQSPAIFNYGVLLAVGFIGMSVYFVQGRPDMVTLTADRPAIAPVTAQRPAQNATQGADRAAQLASLVGQLETRLAGEQANDPNGWLIYARSLMSLNRYDDALKAYDRVVLLTDGRLSVVEERESARVYIAQGGRSLSTPPILDARPQRGPSEQDVRDAETMSDADRQAMIQGMVDGLAARLEDDPTNAADWARLIRARQVLGQTDQAAADVARLRVALVDDPDTVAKILQSAGWTEAAD